MAKSKRNAATKLVPIEPFEVNAPVMPPVEPDPGIRLQDMQQAPAGG